MKAVDGPVCWLRTGLRFRQLWTVVPDDPEALKRALMTHMETSDLIVISGGTGLGPRIIPPRRWMKFVTTRYPDWRIVATRKY